MSSLYLIVLCGCSAYNPVPIDDLNFRERAQAQLQGNVRVTAVVLSAAESEAAFGVPLYKNGMQPIWLEIENNEKTPVWFLPVSIHPDYFAPFEVAYKHRAGFSKAAKAEMERYIYEQSMRIYIAPGRVASGFVFTPLDMGSKDFNVDIVGDDPDVRTFTFFISVPGLRVDHQEVNWHKLYGAQERVDYHEQAFRQALANLPCCTTNQRGNASGGPLNLVIIGSGVDVHRAFLRSGWDETAADHSSSAAGVDPAAAAAPYRYEPANPLYLYGRQQDVVFRRGRTTGRERSQVWLWLSPMTVDGTNVWVGQISREVPQRSTSETAAYAIDPDVDGASRYLLQTLLFAQGLAKYGFVQGGDAASMQQPRQTFNGNLYFTDGYRVVLWVSQDLISFSDVDFVHWDIPPRQ